MEAGAGLDCARSVSMSLGQPLTVQDGEQRHSAIPNLHSDIDG